MRVSSGLLSRALRQRRGRALLWAAGALVGAAALIAAACSGGDSDASQPPAPEPAPQAAEVAPAATPAAEEGAAAQAAEAAAGEDEPELAAVTEAPPEPSSVVAGTDTSIRSVELDKISFDLFNGTRVTLPNAPEGLILQLRDVIPPMDANRALLNPSVAERVGSPVYLPAAEAEGASYLPESGLVVGYVADDGQPYAFPISILNFHEIVNDTLGGRAVLITYCPLCRSGAVFERVLEGEVLTFGNTSALFQSDLVMFDRQSNSYWFQTGGEAVVGARTGQRLTLLPSVMMPWSLWVEAHPDTLVLSDQTGFQRPYASNAYVTLASMVDQGFTPYPVDDDVLADLRLPLAELVLGMEVGETARAYPLRSLGTLAVNDELAGQPVVVFINAAREAGAAFDPIVDGERLTFLYEDVAFVDADTGTTWSLDGLGLEGPLAGVQLKRLPARTAFWFSYLSAFRDATIAGVDVPES